MCYEMQLGGIVVKPEIIMVPVCGYPKAVPAIAIKFEVMEPLTWEKAEELAAEIKKRLR